MLFQDITIIGEGYEVIEHANLLTEGNRIVYIGSELPAGYQGEVYEGKNKVLAPGFFNMHCHVPMGLMRGYGEGLPLDRWLHEKIFPFEDRMTGEDMYWGTLLGISELLASGAVSFTDMYMQMEHVTRAVAETNIKANLSHGTTSFDQSQTFFDTNGYKGIKYLLEYKKTDRSDRIIADCSLHGEYTSHEQVVRQAADFAKEHGLRMHLHLSETEKEHAECKARHDGKTPAAWFAHCGVFDAPVIAAHCVHIEQGDIELMARHGVTAVTCPSSNLKLGSGVAPVKQLLEGGVNLCVGTDGAASNNNLNALEEINLAAMLHKGANRDPNFLSTCEVLQLATKNGAKAQGRSDCGEIKVGNRADLIVFDFDRPHLIPVHDVRASLLYSANASDIVLTMVDGDVLYQNGIYKTIDIERVKFEARRIADEKRLQLQ